MSWAYLYDGSWDGFLTAVFRAFSTKEWPQAVLPEENAQLALDQVSVRIITEPALARRVERGVIRHIGSAAHLKIWTAFLSGDPEKSTIIYRYICTGLQKGRSIYVNLAHDDVLAIDRLYTHIHREAHLLRGFVRFSLMENGVYYGRISPKNSPLPLLMPFFSDRYSDQPFLLYDSTNCLAGVHDRKGWYLVETGHLNLPPLAEEELPSRALWKLFYHTIAIAQRENPKCRRGHMPNRYWENMLEMNSLA